MERLSHVPAVGNLSVCSLRSFHSSGKEENNRGGKEKKSTFIILYTTASVCVFHMYCTVCCIYCVCSLITQYSTYFLTYCTLLLLEKKYILDTEDSTVRTVYKKCEKHLFFIFTV